jgi:hypothetical protein
MSWRPEGWVNPHCNDIEATDYEPGDQFLHTAFEDGADALLDALGGTGCESMAHWEGCRKMAWDIIKEAESYRNTAFKETEDRQADMHMSRLVRYLSSWVQAKGLDYPDRSRDVIRPTLTHDFRTKP